jgi:hypothetical protein
MPTHDFDHPWLRERIGVLRFHADRSDPSTAYSPHYFLERIEALCPECGCDLMKPDEARVRPFHQHRGKAFTVTCEGCQRVSTGVFYR